MKRVFAVLLVLTLLTCTLAIPVSAKKTTTEKNDIEIIIHDEVSEETKEKIERYFANGAPAEDDGTTTYGLTCTLLGHKIECTSISTIEHKVRATSPRCLEKTYDYEECTRCDYEKATLVNSMYIVCCS